MKLTRSKVCISTNFCIVKTQSEAGELHVGFYTYTSKCIFMHLSIKKKKEYSVAELKLEKQLTYLFKVPN